MCTLTKSSLEQLNEFLGVSEVQIVVDKFTQFISMYHNVQTTYLGEAEFLTIHTGEAHLEQEMSEFNGMHK